nr:MAG TPA: hypothetical protein [Caudoviricetes sp.]
MHRTGQSSFACTRTALAQSCGGHLLKTGDHSPGVMVWTEMPSRYSANRVTPVMAKLSDTAVV